LAEGIEVAGASLDNGLLHVDIMRPFVEPKVRKVEIKAEPKRKPGTAIEID
jgi:HSP20 family molecular chaperone IbpA